MAPATSTPPEIALIAAVAQGRVVGVDKRMPWHLPEDLRHFRELTTGHAIIMGRTTHASIGTALPHRQSIVLSSRAIADAGVQQAASLQEALGMVTLPGPVFVIGGTRPWRDALPLAQRMYLTEIEQAYPGDTFFPDFDAGEWEVVSRRPGMDDTPAYAFVEYRRIKPA